MVLPSARRAAVRRRLGDVLGSEAFVWAVVLSLLSAAAAVAGAVSD